MNRYTTSTLRTLQASAQFILAALVATALLTACNLEQEIEIELPDYDGRVVVESYLAPGEPFRVLLTKTSPYFEPFPTANDEFLSNILEEGASVTISHKGVVYTLTNQLGFDFATGKLYNYSNNALVPNDLVDEFTLDITLSDGRTIAGSTRLLPVVPIDSLVVQYRQDDTLARVLTYFTDNPGETNYYRRMFHQSSLDSLPLQDFAIEDQFLQGTALFGTNYNFVAGDTLIATLFHIDKAYFEFFNSVANANAANGNPFGQPSPIKTALTGTADAIGVFTGLVYDRKVVIVPE